MISCWNTNNWLWNFIFSVQDTNTNGAKSSWLLCVCGVQILLFSFLFGVVWEWRTLWLKESRKRLNILICNEAVFIDLTDFNRNLRFSGGIFSQRGVYSRFVSILSLKNLDSMEIQRYLDIQFKKNLCLISEDSRFIRGFQSLETKTKVFGK